MLGLARLLIIWFVVLSLIYICLSLYSRAVCKERLRKEWEGDKERNGDPEIFIQNGLKDYDQSLRRKLILGVYILPTVLVCLIIYLTNFA